MSDKPEASPAACSSPECCRLGEHGRVQSEYDEAINLIRSVRAATSHLGPERGRYWSLPASRISADFYCTAVHPKFGWFCLLADAAGHGLASAVFALHTPMLFRESVLRGMSLAAIHERIHHFLLRLQLSSYYVCGILMRIQGREIEVINAGMPDALLMAADGRLSEAFPSRYLPFGIDRGSDRHRKEGKNNKGNKGDSAGREANRPVPQRYRLARDESASMLLYSDGLSEQGILTGAAFGRDGVLATAVSGADQVFDRLLERIAENTATLHDDVSMALIPVPFGEPPQ